MQVALQQERVMRKKRTNVVFGLEPVCTQRCSCRKFLIECGQRLSDTDMVYPVDALEEMEEIIFWKLLWVTQWCVSPDFRKYAEDQLTDPWWDLQKQRNGLTVN
jgi:hypothetical protein